MTADTPQAEAWNGVPENPERDGAHWIIGWSGSPFVAEWEADPSAQGGGTYGWFDGGDTPAGVVAQGWGYGGPCLTPSEITAREAVAQAEGWAVARDAAFEAGREQGVDEGEARYGGHETFQSRERALAALTPPPDFKAVLAARDAALVEAAVLAEREACAALALEMSWTDLAGVKTQSSKAIAIAAAIRARSGQ